MNSGQPQIDAIRALGYSEQESRFLYLVATHSGYFVARQFLGFTGGRSRQRTSLFWAKLQASQHARIYRFAQSGTVYHLSSQKIYRQIGLENLPNRRGHEFEYICTRIAGLDFAQHVLRTDAQQRRVEVANAFDETVFQQMGV